MGGVPALIWYWVTSFRYIASHTRLGEIRLHSGAKGSSVLKTILLFGLGIIGVTIAIMAVFLAFGSMFVAVVAGATGGKPAGGSIMTMVVAGLVLILPLYLGVLLLFQIISYWWLRIPILRHLTTTLAVENLDKVEQILQSSKPRQRFGVADSFDIGAI